MSAAGQCAALAATGVGVAAFYLASPRQQLLRRPLPARAGRLSGAAMLVLAGLLWGRELHPATALFVALTTAMLFAMAYPAVAALAAGRRQP